MDTLTIIISFASILIALFAAWISGRTLNEQKRIAKVSNNYSLLMQANSLIIEYPELLGIHNITSDELQNANVTEKEVVYILQSIQAAQSYYEVENSSRVNINTLSLYRQNFLRNKKVRSVWTTFMREKLIVSSPFSNAVDEFYKTHPETTNE
jgi:hypothetical protein